jgi:hypothetical protein
MRRNDKLTEQQELERRKRIPLRTQKTLGDMIRRRFAELCDTGSRPQQVSLRPQNPAPPHKT